VGVPYPIWVLAIIKVGLSSVSLALIIAALNYSIL
jgi:hypothetical protein